MCSMGESWEGASEGCLIYPCSCLVKLKVDILAIGISASTSSIEHDPRPLTPVPGTGKVIFLSNILPLQRAGNVTRRQLSMTGSNNNNNRRRRRERRRSSRRSSSNCGMGAARQALKKVFALVYMKNKHTNKIYQEIYHKKKTQTRNEVRPKILNVLRLLLLLLALLSSSSSC